MTRTVLREENLNALSEAQTEMERRKRTKGGAGETGRSSKRIEE